MLDVKKEVDFHVIWETLFCTIWGVLKPFTAKGSQVYSTREEHIPRVRCVSTELTTCSPVPSPLQHTSNTTPKWFSFLMGTTLGPSAFFENKSRPLHISGGYKKIPVKLAANSLTSSDLFYYVHLAYVLS